MLRRLLGNVRCGMPDCRRKAIALVGTDEMLPRCRKCTVDFDVMARRNHPHALIRIKPL